MDPLLKSYLAERDVPCPGCGYNLRGLAEEKCPECGLAIELGVCGSTTNLGWLLTTIIVLAMEAGLAWIAIVARTVHEFVHSTRFSPSEWRGPVALAVTSTFPLILVICLRGTFLASRRIVQRSIAAGACVYVVLSVAACILWSPF